MNPALAVLQCNGRPWVHPRHEQLFDVAELVDYLRGRTGLQLLPRVPIKLGGHRCTAASLGLLLDSGPLTGPPETGAGGPHVRGERGRAVLLRNATKHTSGGGGQEPVGSVTAQLIAEDLWLVSALATSPQGLSPAPVGRGGFSWARMLCIGDDVGAAVSATLRAAVAKSSLGDPRSLMLRNSPEVSDADEGFAEQVIRVAEAALIYPH